MARKKENYNDLLNKLEEIINNLQSSNLDLEESMKSYEEGVSLVNKLYKILNDYQGKMTIINNNIEKNFEE